MAKISDFQQLVDKLIDGRDLEVDNFNGEYDSDKTQYSRRANLLWEQLLHHIQSGVYNSDSDQSKKHYYIRENDFLNPNSENYKTLVQFISEHIDLDLDLKEKNEPIDFFSLYINSKINEEGSHWNESIAKLADYYYKLFYSNEYDDERIDSSQFKYGDLKNADAGFSFSNSPYVKPNENGDKTDNINDTYETIRGRDKVIRVLKDMSNLQFTQDKQLDTAAKQKINQYLRLIMPEYQREVQIEDLNRNFWVIGQALTALFAFLFDDNSVYPALLKALLDEIIQLWENVFYLWIGFSVINQKLPYEDIKLLFIPVSYYENGEIGVGDIKFDDFAGDNCNTEEIFNFSEYETPEESTERRNRIINNSRMILERIWNNDLSYLKNKYDNCALAIIPEIRCKNYAHNYYSKAIYPGIIFYDNSLSKDRWLNFCPFEYPVIVDMKELKIFFKEDTLSFYQTRNIKKLSVVDLSYLLNNKG